MILLFNKGLEKVMKKVFGSADERLLKATFFPNVERINAMEGEFNPLTDAELVAVMDAGSG